MIPKTELYLTHIYRKAAFATFHVLRNFLKTQKKIGLRL